MFVLVYALIKEWHIVPFNLEPFRASNPASFLALIKFDPFLSDQSKPFFKLGNKASRRASSKGSGLRRSSGERVCERVGVCLKVNGMAKR